MELKINCLIDVNSITASSNMWGVLYAIYFARDIYFHFAGIVKMRTLLEMHQFGRMTHIFYLCIFCVRIKSVCFRIRYMFLYSIDMNFFFVIHILSITKDEKIIAFCCVCISYVCVGPKINNPKPPTFDFKTYISRNSFV